MSTIRDIDERGRSAAAAVHAAIATLPDADSSERPQGSRNGAVLLAAAVVVVVGLVALALVVVGDGDGESGLVTEGPGDTVRLVLEEPPPGLVPVAATDLTTAHDAATSADLWVYGRPDQVDPFGQIELGVGVLRPGAGESEVLLPDGPPIEVEGRQGVVLSAAASMDGRTTIFVPAGDGQVLVTSSATLDDAELSAIAAQVELEEQSVVLPDDLPAGLELVGQATGMAAPGDEHVSLLPLPAGIVTYRSPADPSRSVSLAAVTADGNALAVRDWSTAGRAEPVEVRGTTGSLVVTPDLDLLELSWVEPDGTLVVVEARGVDADEVLASVLSLRPATEGEWAELRSGLAGREETSQQAGGDAVAALRGPLADGRSWELTALADGTYQLAAGEAFGSIGLLGGSQTPDVMALSASLPDGSVLLFGRVAASVGTDVEIELVGPDGSSSLLQASGLVEATSGELVFAAQLGADELTPTSVRVRTRDTGDIVAETDVPDRPGPPSPE